MSEISSPDGSNHRVAAKARGRQIVGLDLLRLIAAISVVMYHFGYHTSAPGHDAYLFSHGAASFPELAPFCQYGWMGVPAFFVISGFVIAFSASEATPSSFLAARILRLLPAVWICAPLSALCVFLSTREAPAHIIGRLANSLILFPIGPQIDGVYWTLCIEIFFYSAVFMLLYSGRFSRFFAFICLIASISTLFDLLLAMGYSQVDVSERWTNFLLMRYGCEFALGALTYDVHRNGVDRRRLIFLLIALVGSYAQVTPLLRPLATDTIIWSAFLAAFFSLVAANALIADRCTPSVLRLVRTIGKATYPLYLIHQVVGSYLLYLLVSGGLTAYPALATMLAAILLLTAIVCHLEEKLRGWLRPRVYRLCNRMNALLTVDAASGGREAT